jgi:cytochrome c-type biogenesis protein CcsB
MINTRLVTAVTFLYLFCFVFYFIYLFFRSRWWGKAATLLTAVSFGLHTAAILFRWWESYQVGFGHVPLANLFESLVFFSWCITLLYLLWERKIQSKVVGAFALPFAFLTLAYASLAGVPQGIDPLIPALQSNWLHAHVLTCFLSYASFAISCGVSIMYLWKRSDREKGGEATGFITLFPSLDSLDTLVYKTIALGFPLLTIGIVTGAAWANFAWGSYWSWDPKETWSLITWFVYALFLHARLAREWRGKRTAILSIIGFAAVIFTYFGVNYLLAGLHSYA